MAGVKVTVTAEKLRLNYGEIVGPGGPLHTAFTKAAARTRDRAKENLTAAGRIDTGLLRNSIKYEVHASGRDITATVGSDVSYAGYIHDGTANNGAGYIYPRRALYLRFSPKGSSTVVFAKRVRGIVGTPYLQDAIDALREADFS